MKYIFTLFLLLLLTSCSENVEKAGDGKANDNVAEHDHDHDDEHHHEAPNGGILTEVGEHAASLEWLVEDGQFKIYIFDGCAEKPIRLTQTEVNVTVKTDKENALVLKAVTDKLSGEKPGDANTFTSPAPNLSTEKISSISVQSVTIQSINYKNVNLTVE